MDPNVQKAFDFAQESAKQLIALGTGVVALTITFLDDVAGDADAGRAWLVAAWVLYLVSVVAGVFTLQALAGNLERPVTGRTPSIYGRSIVLLARVQVGAFLVALAATLVYGTLAL